MGLKNRCCGQISHSPEFFARISVGRFLSPDYFSPAPCLGGPLIAAAMLRGLDTGHCKGRRLVR